MASTSDHSRTGWYKLTATSGVSRGMRYKEGLHTDIHPFNPNIPCGKGGLYFCRGKDVMFWFARRLYSDALLWDVVVPEGAHMRVYTDKAKASSIILSNPRPMKRLRQILRGLPCEPELTVEEILILVPVRPEVLALARKQTDDLCLAAVQLNELALEFVQRPTPAMRLAAEKRS